MNILLTNDDGYEAPGLHALFSAVRHIGRVFVVAPMHECSACSHTVTMRRPVRVERRHHERVGSVFAVDGTPADCVRIGLTHLVEERIDLVVSGVNSGANSGVDVFYSGTVAGAREAAILNIPAMAFSQALRGETIPDWKAVTELSQEVIQRLIEHPLPGPGFWSINYPAPIPPDARDRIHHVPIESVPAPVLYERHDHDDGQTIEFRNGGSYWTREAADTTDYTIIRDGGVAITAIPLYGKF